MQETIKNQAPVYLEQELRVIASVPVLCMHEH